jgi:hypothetical protein
MSMEWTMLQSTKRCVYVGYVLELVVVVVVVVVVDLLLPHSMPWE